MVLLREARGQKDETLIESCQNGDSTAFDELVRRYKDRVYSVIYRLVGNHEDALDVAQECFVRAYQAIDRFEGRAQVYTWLYSIAANLARNRLRDRGRKGRNKSVSLEILEEVAPGGLEDASSQSPRGVVMEAETRELLQQSLDELPDQYRLAFVLRMYEDMSYDEIAEVMGCPKGTVKSRLNAARAMLRDRLTAQGLL